MGQFVVAVPPVLCASHLSVRNLHQSNDTRLQSAPGPSPNPMPQILTRNLLRVNRNTPLTSLSARGLSRGCLGDQ
jgi:hypothetical protein